MNLHHGDSNVASLLNDHGLISAFQFWCWQATKSEIHAWCWVRGASWEALQLLHVVLLNRFLLWDRHGLHLHLPITETMLIPKKNSKQKNTLLFSIWKTYLHIWHMHYISILVFGLHYNSRWPATADIIFVEDKWCLLRVCVWIGLKPPKNARKKF